MRRTILYTAGLMIAAGASLALAGPASAAPKNPTPHWGGYNSYSHSAPVVVIGQSAWRSPTVLVNNVGNWQGDLCDYNRGGSASGFAWTYGGGIGY